MAIETYIHGEITGILNGETIVWNTTLGAFENGSAGGGVGGIFESSNNGTSIVDGTFVAKMSDTINFESQDLSAESNLILSNSTNGNTVSFGQGTIGNILYNSISGSGEVRISSSEAILSTSKTTGGLTEFIVDNDITNTRDARIRYLTTNTQNHFVFENTTSWSGSAQMNLILDNANNFYILQNNFNFGIGKVPAETLDVNGNTNTDGIYKVNGTNGFTGTGAFTTLTIVGGIITNAV